MLIPKKLFLNDLCSYVFVFVLLYCTAASTALAGLSITLSDGDDLNATYPWESLTKKPLVRVTYSTDACLSESEFDYLTDLREGSFLDGSLLKQAAAYLFAKKKFKTISFDLSDDTDRYILHCSLESHWTFERAIIKGILFDRERYATLYGMNFGDIFDTRRHEHGIQKILDMLKDEGYPVARIIPSYIYNKRTKSVTVNLSIHKGKRFHFNTISLVITSEDGSQYDTRFLEYALKQKYVSKLRRSGYHKHKLIKLMSDISTFLEREGYLHGTIEKTEVLNRAKAEINVSLAMSVSSYRQFVFVGNVFFTQKKLRDYIAQLGKSAWLVPASLLVQEMSNRYKNSGFLSVLMNVQEEKNKCIFFITEGQRFRVAQVIIKNSSFIDPALIKTFFKKTLHQTYFDHDIFQQEVTALQDFYVRQGFLDIHISGYQFNHQSENTTILEVMLDEGQRYKVGSVLIKDDADKARTMHEQFFDAYFTNDLLAAQRKKLLTMLSDEGHQDWIIRPDIKKIDSSHVGIEWTVKPAPKKSCNKVVLQGSVDLPFNRLLQEITLNKGSASFKDAFMRFKEFNVFESVHFSSLGGAKGLVGDAMGLRLQQESPYEIRLRTGLELENVSYTRAAGQGLGYKLGGSFIVKNPLKRCDLFRSDIDLARFHYEVGFTYQYPWLFNMPLRSLFKLYLTMQDHPAFIGSSQNLYTIYQRGLLSSLNRKYGLVEGTLNLGFDWTKTVIKHTHEYDGHLFNAIAQAINFKPALIGKFVPYFVLEPIFFLDCLDDKMNPQKGLLTVASIKALIALSSSFYASYSVKCLVEQSFFWPIKAIVAALRIRFGHIFHHEFSTLMPTQRFYLGGSQSLRGYYADLAPPLGSYESYEQGVPKRVIVPRGAKSMININMELRIPLPRKIGVVLFQDLGTLADDVRAHFNTDKLLATTGFGLRYQTPLGPLRFDIGWKWFEDTFSHKSFGWYLAIGNAF